MLNHQAKERLCRVGPEQPMGLVLRRFWLPVLLASELSPNADPKGVELLGERFVAWRDELGRPGLYAEACLHRGASMRLARSEGDGLRCIYHGWKFAVDGAVLETPNVADPKFRQRIRGRTYPVREAGGLLWAYLGPREREPEFPLWPWLELPDANRLVTRHVEECNFVQVIEGLVDSSHLGLLHMNGLSQSGSAELGFAQKVSSMQHNLAPRLEVEDTPFGFYYAALRDIKDEEGSRTEARVAAFVAPCIVLNPNGDIATFVVPMSDTKTAFIHVFWSETLELNREPLRSRHLEFIGLTPRVLEAFGLTDETLGRADRPGPHNNFLQDREAMRRGESWSGMPGLIEEDVAASVSAGPVRDRADETLSASDIGIARLYRALLSCADAVEQGQDPLGIQRGVDWSQVAGMNDVLGERQWRDLLPQRAANRELAQ
jgi:phthalate 4,5-dioxygenase oxygenase subunit